METGLERTDLATSQEAVKVMRRGAMVPNQATGSPTGMVVKDLIGAVAATSMFHLFIMLGTLY
jgi:hypothetical protein